MIFASCSEPAGVFFQDADIKAAWFSVCSRCVSWVRFEHRVWPVHVITRQITINVVKTIINHPFGNCLYHPFMVIWGMVYYCFNHIYYFPWQDALERLYNPPCAHDVFFHCCVCPTKLFICISRNSIQVCPRTNRKCKHVLFFML